LDEAAVDVTEFMDIELVSADEAASPDVLTVAFDVIYPGETWCRSVVDISAEAAGRMAHDQRIMISAARDAVLELLQVEAGPVSFHLRLEYDHTAILARGRPGPRGGA